MCARFDDELRISYYVRIYYGVRHSILGTVACFADSCHNHTSSDFVVFYLVQPNETPIFMIKETLLPCKQMTKQKTLINLRIQMNR
jgi:hypothetical protein